MKINSRCDQPGWLKVGYRRWMQVRDIYLNIFCDQDKELSQIPYFRCVISCMFIHILLNTSTSANNKVLETSSETAKDNSFIIHNFASANTVKQKNDKWHKIELVFSACQMEHKCFLWIYFR